MLEMQSSVKPSIQLAKKELQDPYLLSFQPQALSPGQRWGWGWAQWAELLWFSPLWREDAHCIKAAAYHLT